jgi:phospholipase C
MRHRSRLKSTCAVIAATAMLQPTMLLARDGQIGAVRLGPPSSAAVQKWIVPADREPRLGTKAKLDLLRQKIKYVFVLFQENRSFDFYFGTFPGAEGYFSGSGTKAGLTQPIVDVNKSVTTISPFLIPQSISVKKQTVPFYPEDTDSVDHSHSGIDNSMDVVSGVSQNDRYALNEEGYTTVNGQIVTISGGVPVDKAPKPSLAAKQFGELVMSHIDCDTAPVMWQYADRFALFDNFHQGVIGPSTPNAIAMVAGQSGVTQWALHPAEGANNTGSPSVQESGGQPVLADPGPFAGSDFDQSPVKPPYGLDDESPATPALNQTYASLPLSFMGHNIDSIIQSDENPALDLADVQSDIKTISSKDPSVNWAWYQEGWAAEPTDGPNSPTGTNYIVHHNGPQYFGYIGDNTVELPNFHSLYPFFGDIAAGNIKPGVTYVRGGYGNDDGLLPVDPNPAVQSNFPGNDDHPGYSDLAISNALVADEVNAIANSPYWAESAIIITYDETDGLYDHVPVTISSNDPFGAPLAPGPRIPAIILSPYSAVHTISSNYAEHNSVIKFIDELFGLKPLENLPDEVKARALGQSEFGQPNLTPLDAESYIDDLTDAFDNARLTGKAAPLPGSYAAIPTSFYMTFPQYNGEGCAALNITPTDYQNGTLIDPAPADFNPRPSTTPGNPESGNWTP